MSIAAYQPGDGFKKITVDRERLTGRIKSNKLKAFLLIHLSFLVGMSLENDIHIVQLNTEGTLHSSKLITFKFNDGSGKIVGFSGNFMYSKETDSFEYDISKSDTTFEVGHAYIIGVEKRDHMLTGTSVTYRTHELPQMLTVEHMNYLSSKIFDWLM